MIFSLLVYLVSFDFFCFFVFFCFFNFVWFRLIFFGLLWFILVSFVSLVRLLASLLTSFLVHLPFSFHLFHLSRRSYDASAILFLRKRLTINYA